VIGTVTGIVMFVVTILLAVHVGTYLAVRSAVVAETHDAARRVARGAAAGDRAGAAAREQAALTTRFAAQGGVDAAVRVEPGQVVVTVTIRRDAALAGLDRVFGIGTVRHEARVRAEEVR
jgi:hypothetical protein